LDVLETIYYSSERNWVLKNFKELSVQDT